MEEIINTIVAVGFVGILLTITLIMLYAVWMSSGKDKKNKERLNERTKISN